MLVVPAHGGGHALLERDLRLEAERAQPRDVRAAPRRAARLRASGHDLHVAPEGAADEPGEVGDGRLPVATDVVDAAMLTL